MMLDEQTLTLIRGLCVALPFDDDPVGTVARALGRERRALVAEIARLQASGVLEGVWGEPNPGWPGLAPVLAWDAPEGFTRWRGRAADGRWLSSAVSWSRVPFGGQFFKAGIPIATGGLLNQSHERTFLVTREEGAPSSLASGERAVAERLFVPRRFEPERDFWEQAGGGIAAKEELRQTVRRLVMAKVFRRLAFRWNPSALYAGCGLACWDFNEAGHLAGEAGKALARVAGTGDVCFGGPGGEFPFHLIALFVGQERGAGEKAAREAARQWGRNLAQWIDLEIH